LLHFSVSVPFHIRRIQHVVPRYWVFLSRALISDSISLRSCPVFFPPLFLGDPQTPLLPGLPRRCFCVRPFPDSFRVPFFNCRPNDSPPSPSRLVTNWDAPFISCRDRKVGLYAFVLAVVHSPPIPICDIIAVVCRFLLHPGAGARRWHTVLVGLPSYMFPPLSTPRIQPLLFLS